MSLLLPHEIEAMKRNIEAQLAEYEREIADFAAFMEDLRRRYPQAYPQPAGEAADA